MLNLSKAYSIIDFANIKLRSMMKLVSGFFTFQSVLLTKFILYFKAMRSFAQKPSDGR